MDEVEFPLQDWLDAHMEQGDGTCRSWLTVQPKHLNPHGVVQGAVPYFLLDTAMGGAAMTVLGDDSWCTTVDIHTRYLAPCFGGTMTANATVRRAGKRLVFLDAIVTGEDGTEYVTGSGVFAVIPAQA